MKWSTRQRIKATFIVGMWVWLFSMQFYRQIIISLHHRAIVPLRLKNNDHCSITLYNKNLLNK